MNNEYLHAPTGNPNDPKKVDIVRIKWGIEENPDLTHISERDYSDYPKREAEKYKAQDGKRLNAYNAGEWRMIYCKAFAIVSYPIGRGSRKLETITSGGLYGIESDSTKDYLKEVGQGQIADLRDHLKQLCNLEFSDSIISLT
jgi:hypothetical protein